MQSTSMQDRISSETLLHLIRFYVTGLYIYPFVTLESISRSRFTRSHFFCILFLLSCLDVIAQRQAEAEFFPFHDITYYTSEDGLNGSEVYWITQDRHGFMWFITDNALNRYDGYTFRSYGYRPDDEHTLSPGWYWGLTEDKEGKLWIPSQESGLYSFSPQEERFMHYRHQAENISSLISDNAYAVIPDRHGGLWIGTTQGLDNFDPRTETFTHFQHHPDDPTSLTDNYILCMVRDSDDPDLIWIISSKPAIDCFSTATGRVVKHFELPFSSSLYRWNENPYLNIHGMRNGNIWIGSNDNGIFGFNARTEKFIHIPIGRRCVSAGHVNGFYNVTEDHAGNLWTVNDNNEIVYYHSLNQKFYFHPVRSNNIRFHDFSSLIYEDLSHKLWIGTNNGLVSINSIQKNIHVCRHDPENPNSISGDFVFGISGTSQGKLLVGTFSGVDVFDQSTRAFSRLSLSDRGRQISTYGAWAFYQDSKDINWIAGVFGLASYDAKNKTGRLYGLHDSTGSVSSAGTLGIIEDKGGAYWITNWYGGLYSFNPASGAVRNVDIPGLPSTRKVSLGPMFMNQSGTLFIHGWETGLITFNPDNRNFSIFRHDADQQASLSQESAMACIESRNGLIWISSFGGGINVFNPITEKFVSFSTEDGLAHNSVVSLIEDKNGNYWAGTRGGISCFTPPEDPFAPGCQIVFRNYDVSDGLPSNVINNNSAFCDEDGTLYFGTRNGGMFYFHPDDLTDNAFIPPVYITDLSLLNKPVSIRDSNSFLTTPIEYSSELRLTHRHNTISFTFAALNYIDAEKNKYAYRLSSFNEDWIFTDASRRFATYTNLDPGEYLFQVKASNNDGKWNETPVELSIIITPPFWVTWWFRLMALCAIAAAIYSLYRFRLNQIIKLQLIRNRIAHDLHDNIGSTLNSISIYSEVAQRKSDVKIPELDMISESSRKVMDAMSDIVWTINPENDSFAKIIFRMHSQTHYLMNAKGIEYSFKVDEGFDKITLPMQTRQNIYLIYKEAVNNILKYSNASNVSIALFNSNSKVTLTIEDDGIGFDEARSSYGNGLRSMRSRASAMKADFAISSKVGEGTKIHLRLTVK